MDTPEQAVNAEVNRRVEAVAEAAAAQVDQANKDAEAIARAATQTEHMARLNDLEGKLSQWQTETTQRIEATKAETLAMIEASQVSILSKLQPPPPPTTIVTEPPPSDTSPMVSPDNEGDEPKSKSQPTEPQGSKDQEQQSQGRKRAVL